MTAKASERGHGRQVGREAENGSVGLCGQQVLLEEELDAVGQRLEQAPRAGAVGPDAVLHVGNDLALEPDHHQHRNQQEDERDDDLEDDDEHHREVDAVGEQRVHQVAASRLTGPLGSWGLHTEVGDRLGRVDDVRGETLPG